MIAKGSVFTFLNITQKTVDNTQPEEEEIHTGVNLQKCNKHSFKKLIQNSSCQLNPPFSLSKEHKNLFKYDLAVQISSFSWLFP